MGLRPRRRHDIVSLDRVGVDEPTDEGSGHRPAAQNRNLPAHSAATSSASCTALRAAPFRRLSAEQKNTSPLPAGAD